MSAVWSIVRKDFRAYYLKPPLITWAILMPLVLIVAFYLRNPQDIAAIVPGLIGMTILFGATSMEGIVFTFEKRVGALERLLMAPVSLLQVVVAKVLSGTLFGIGAGLVILLAGAAFLDLGPVSWYWAVVIIVLTSFTLASLGMWVATWVKEVFEAMTLFNFFRFPMVFLCGVFIPVAAMALPLRVVAYVLPLTYAVDGLKQTLSAPDALLPMAVDLLVLTAFGLTFLLAAERTLAWRLRKEY